MKITPIFDEKIRIRDWPAVLVYCVYFLLIFGWDAFLRLFKKER